MSMSAVYIDLGGVLNCKIVQHGGVDHIQWLKDDTTQAIVQCGAFHLDGNEQTRLPMGRFHIHWLRKLATVLYDLVKEGWVNWTDSPPSSHINVLTRLLGWNPIIVHSTVCVYLGHQRTPIDR